MLSVQHFFTFSCCQGTFFLFFFSWNERFSKSRATVVEIKLTRVHFGSISCDDQRVSLQVVTSRGWKCFSPTWTGQQKQTQWHKCSFCHHVFTSSGVCNIIPYMLLAECTFLHVSLLCMKILLSQCDLHEGRIPPGGPSSTWQLARTHLCRVFTEQRR